MTDEARIARLTELARRVWTSRTNVRVVHDREYDAAIVLYDAASRDTRPLVSIPHPRALDALEAALLVLAGDAKVHPDGALRDAYLAGANAGYTEQTKWVEQLAARWDELHEGGYNASFAECARELRERARGEP